MQFLLAKHMIETEQQVESKVSSRDRDKEARRLRRKERYDRVIILYQRTHSIREVAKITGLSRKTVRRYVNAGAFPERRPRPHRPSVLDPYLDYIHKRWTEGCHNSHQLFREILDKGYTGSATTARTYVAKMRDGQPVQKLPREIKPSPRRLRWLFSQPRDRLNVQHLDYLERLFKQEPKAKQVYGLVQEFLDMLTRRHAHNLDGWLEKVENSKVRFLRSFARGIIRDYDAVAAALKHPWSNGQVEGHVNRLKTLKRQMYGRAGIKLLRSRFLGMC